LAASLQVWLFVGGGVSSKISRGSLFSFSPPFSLIQIQSRISEIGLLIKGGVWMSSTQVAITMVQFALFAVIIVMILIIRKERTKGEK